jgi:integrase
MPSLSASLCVIRPRRSSAAAGARRRTAPSQAKAWTTRGLARFLEHVEGDRLYALWRLGAMTGMRRGELLGLKWERLHLEGARLAVEEQLLPTRGGVTFGPPKSTRSRRKVALDPDTVDALRAHRETQLLECALAGDAYDDHDLVFCDELGQPIQPERLTYAFTQHRKAAGIPVGTLHTLRHTHTTDLLSNGVPVHVAAARIGDRAETLLKVYAHLLPQSDEQAAREAAARIAAVSA